MKLKNLDANGVYREQQSVEMRYADMDGEVNRMNLYHRFVSKLISRFYDCAT
jgi:hypothetical protein